MANRCYRLAIQGLLNSSYRETDLSFQSGGTADNDTVAAGESLLSAFNSSLLTLWSLTLPASYNTMRLTARRQDLKPSATVCKYYGIGAQQGNRGSDGTGQQTCPSIFLVPTMGTKSGGKIFWPTIPQADLVQSVPTAGWQTAVNNFLAAAISGITAAGITWTLCIFSRKLHTMSSVVSHSFSPVVGFQSRRRKPAGAV